MRVWCSGLVVLCAAGCSETVRGGARDGGPADASDVSAEAGRDASPAPVDLCGAAGIVDANVVGLRAGRATTVIVRGDALPDGALPPGRCPPAEVTPRRRLIVRYTPPVDGFVSAAALPLRAPDGVQRRGAVALRDGCGPAAAELVCAEAGDPFGLRPTARVTAGRPLYVVGALDEGRWSITFHLTPEQGAAGASCEDERACAPEHSCFSGRCVPNGALYTFCRSGASPCDPGLACVEIVPGSGRRQCAVGVRLGEPCDLPRSVCLEGVCGGRLAQRCVLPGGPDAPCRTSGAPCDAGLTCIDGGWCVEARASGDVCVPSALGRPCPSGESCRAVAGGARCFVDGTSGGACRADGSPRCDDGLRCASNDLTGLRCLPLQGEGRACSPASPTDCDPTTDCVPAPDGGGRCVRLGAAGARCTPTSPGDCDPGLACVPAEGSSATRCGAPLRAGQLCGAALVSCEAGARCAEVSTPGSSPRCVLDGAAGGWCRGGATPCDEGLSCSSELRCLPTLAEGAPCTATGPGACATGLRCEGTCRREGTVGGFCRPTATPCDEGGTCLFTDPLASQCVRVIPRGESCAASTAFAVCAEGSSCAAGPDRVARCMPYGSAGTSCAPSTAPGFTCDPGLICSQALGCAAPRREGEACGSAASGECVAGLSCSTISDPPLRCVADGAVGGACRATGAPCDPGLVCDATSVSAGPVCVRPSPVGGPCGMWPTRCAADAACVAGRCVITGRTDSPCRESEPACDDGLRCVLGYCSATAASGCSPRGPACAAPAECLWDGAAYVCAPAPYAVEVRRGVAFEDPCLLDGELLTTPLRFRVFGGDFEVAAGGGVLQLVDPRGSLAWLTHGAATLRPSAGCAVVVGAAPNRRFLMGGGTWATHVTPGVQGASNAVVILHEGSNVVEYRYDDPLPAAGVDAPPAWGAPTLQWSGGGAVYRVTAPVQRLDAGLSVRFTPR